MFVLLKFMLRQAVNHLYTVKYPTVILMQTRKIIYRKARSFHSRQHLYQHDGVSPGCVTWTKKLRTRVILSSTWKVRYKSNHFEIFLGIFYSLLQTITFKTLRSCYFWYGMLVIAQKFCFQIQLDWRAFDIKHCCRGALITTTCYTELIVNC